MFDFIGDIHGYAEPLKQLLQKMNYKCENGIWQHRERKAIFVGDYIDRGPAIRETLQIVRSMVENENAIALMGNHEYNALAYNYQLHDGTFLRKHNEKNNKQHKATLEQFEAFPEEWQSHLDWFYTLPLFIDKSEFKVVHACWDDEQINWLKDNCFHTMTKELLLASQKRNSIEYTVINDTLKGKEFNIPEEYAWPDKDGNSRKENRIKWWIDPVGTKYNDFLFNCPSNLQERMIDEDIEAVVYPKDAPPVFFGHYWMEDSYPVIQAANVACLDYSIAKEGLLVAYRWNGEQVIHKDNFINV
jgi:hypothetical protein